MTPIKAIRNPVIVLAALYAVLLAMLVFFATQLPDRMATHFAGNGEPNGWMSGSSYLAFMAIFGLAFPLLVPGICWASRVLPASVINVPHREYWLSPQRRAQTDAYLFRHALWFAVLQLGFVIVLHGLVVDANGQVPVRLSNAIWGALALFLAGVIAWIVGLLRHFGRPPAITEHPVSN